jgi:hypothetical protein
MHLFLETVLELTAPANRFLEAALQPVVSRNPFVELTAPPLKIGAFVKAAENSSHLYKCISRGGLVLTDL